MIRVSDEKLETINLYISRLEKKCMVLVSYMQRKFCKSLYEYYIQNFGKKVI